MVHNKYSPKDDGKCAWIEVNINYAFLRWDGLYVENWINGTKTMFKLSWQQSAARIAPKLFYEGVCRTDGHGSYSLVYSMVVSLHLNLRWVVCLPVKNPDNVYARTRKKFSREKRKLSKVDQVAGCLLNFETVNDPIITTAQCFQMKKKVGWWVLWT